METPEYGFLKFDSHRDQVFRYFRVPNQPLTIDWDFRSTEDPRLILLVFYDSHKVYLNDISLFDMPAHELETWFRMHDAEVLVNDEGLWCDKFATCILWKLTSSPVPKTAATVGFYLPPFHYAAKENYA